MVAQGKAKQSGATFGVALGSLGIQTPRLSLPLCHSKHVTEAEISLRLDFVLGRVPTVRIAYCSDEKYD